MMAAISLMVAAAAVAGNETGAISPGWFAYSDGIVFLFLSGTHNGSPCTQAERWAIDPATPVGKTHLTVFMLAYAAGKRVALTGDGTCVHGNTEQVTVITVED
jgi:hypothetical protein